MIANRQGKSMSMSRKQRGFTMLEVTMALALSAVITTIYQSAQLIQTAEDAIVQGVAQQLLVVQSATSSYSQINFAQLASGAAISGVAVPLAPTLAELKALTLLTTNVRDVTATNQAIKVQLTRLGCPGVGCQINGLIYVDGPLVLPRTGNTARVDLASVAVQAMKGAGGVSYYDNPGKVRGPSGTMDNPRGTEVGILGAMTLLNTAFYNQFVRVNDPRDPGLQGNLSAAGNANFGGTLTAGGQINAGAAIAAAGDIRSNGNFVAKDAGGCDRATLSSNGSLVIRNAACNYVAVIDSLGRVSLGVDANTRAVLDGSAGSLSLKTSSNVEQVGLSQSPSGGFVTVKDAGGVSTVSLDGAAGKASMRSVAVSGFGTEGAPCGVGVVAGDIVSDVSTIGTILMCRSSVWIRPGLRAGAVGGACATQGQLAQGAGGNALICRGGAWVDLSERVTRQVQIGRFSVVDGTFVGKPACGVGGTPTLLVTPIDVVIDYSGAPPRNRYFASAADVGSGWNVTLRLMDSFGTQFTTSFAGTPYALQGIGTTFCDYTT